MGATLSSLCSTPAEEGRVADNKDVRFSCLAFDCRCLAIETLYKLKIDPASDVDNEQWTQISDMIRRYDDEMSDKRLQELESSAKGYPSIFERIERVSNAFDTGLLSYLQAKVDLMGELGDYLPKEGQSWEEFLKDMNTDCEEENILENVQDSAGLEVLKDMNTDCEEENILQNEQAGAGLEVLKTFKKLTTRLMSAIEGDVKKSGVLQSVQKEKKIKVFYATDRRVCDGSYSSEPGKYLHYGFQQVSIPGVHKRGKVESPNKYGRGNHSKHFMLEAKSGPWSKPIEFLNKIKEECDSECAQNGHSANDVASPTDGPQKNAREVLLYIHGYTVSYNSALKRAAQLKNDLEFGGLVILYSWPTMGQPLAYHRDGRVIMKTADFLRKFIATILGEVSFSEVHILAHSMGNRALIKALTKRGWAPLRHEKLFHQRGVLKNVILAAADEELGKFEGMLREMNNLYPVCGPLISVYSSACDWPLFLSGYINWKLRLGNTVSLFGNHSMRRCDHHMVDVIDASGVRCDSPLQHSYHADAPEVLDDIQKLLTEQKRAGERPVIEPLLHDSGQVFHAFEPSWWEQSRFDVYIRKNRKSSSSNQGHG